MTPETIIDAIGAANTANARGDYEVAQKYCRQVLRFNSSIPEAWYNLGIARRGQGKRAEAIECQTKASLLTQHSADAQNSIGLEFIELDAYSQAERCLNQALAIDPGHTFALSNKANLRQRQRQFGEAEILLRRAIAIQQYHAPLHVNLGAVLNKLARFEAAEQILKRAVELDPSMPEAWNNLANARTGLKNYSEAASACRQAIELGPHQVDAYSNLGDILRESQRYAEACEVYGKLFERAPGIDFLSGRLLYTMMQCCDWSRFDELRTIIATNVRKGRRSADPFGYQAVSESTGDLLKCAKIFTQEYFPADKPYRHRQKPADPRPIIRVGYVSGEFRTQATAMLMAGLYEHHDRDRFKIVAFDNGDDDHSELRHRLELAFDEIVSIKSLDDAEAAQAIASRDIDILVNLNGFFGNGRQGVFSIRPSPIQVNYLGFPGTLGAEYMDYLIADSTVIPETEAGNYLEKIVYLPGCYQANDSKRPISDQALSRAEAGLPEKAFVFCCFNNTYKITPSRFALWMRILKRVEGSVLWLLADNPTATQNLKAAAEALGIPAERLVFGKRLPPADHLARHRLADLFLDSLPYNAHTTASDALWAGLPVLSQTGKTFPGRVATSLLKAIGLPELITTSEVEFEARAVELASDPAQLQSVKAKLIQNRLTTPLFDTAQFTRNIESAYQMMYDRLLAGLPPAHFRV